MTPIPHYRALVDALRARVEKLNLRYDDVEAAATLPDRYFAKLMGRPPLRVMHAYTIFTLLDVLGLQMLVVEGDGVPSLTGRRSTVSSRLRISRKGAWFGCDELRRNGRRGGIAYARKVPQARRRAIARRAARARWRSR